MSKPYYTINDVKEATGIHPGTVCRWFEEGKFEAERTRHGMTIAWTMTPRVYASVCQHAAKRKGRRDPLTVVTSRKPKPEPAPVPAPQKWGSLDEMIAHFAKCKTARKIAPGEAEGAEVWA